MSKENESTTFTVVIREYTVEELKDKIVYKCEEHYGKNLLLRILDRRDFKFWIEYYLTKLKRLRGK